jgi:hypothetical protein
MLPSEEGFLNEGPREQVWFFGYISSRIRILSWIGGWVENNFSSHPTCSPGTREGCDSHR